MTHSVLFEVRFAQARVSRARGNVPYGSGAMHTTHKDACCSTLLHRYVSPARD